MWVQVQTLVHTLHQSWMGLSKVSHFAGGVAQISSYLQSRKASKDLAADESIALDPHN